MKDDRSIFLVDDDEAIRRALARALTKRGYKVEPFESAEAYLDRFDPKLNGCLLIDVRMPGISGLELQDALLERGSILPVIFLTGHGDVPDSVRALKAGAVDFLQKPFRQKMLLGRLDEAFTLLKERRENQRLKEDAIEHYRRLTEREVEVLNLLVSEQAMRSNKDIAKLLGISHRTVDHHRARIMEKMGASNPLQLYEMTARAKSS